MHGLSKGTLNISPSFKRQKLIQNIKLLVYDQVNLKTNFSIGADIATATTLMLLAQLTDECMEYIITPTKTIYNLKWRQSKSQSCHLLEDDFFVEIFCLLLVQVFKIDTTIIYSITLVTIYSISLIRLVNLNNTWWKLQNQRYSHHYDLWHTIDYSLRYTFLYNTYSTLIYFEELTIHSTIIIDNDEHNGLGS
ncbi:hypothetical protein FF38_06660 [Lucilia cuprina]|uniref:Uncharacterized protein n=1 Tax=Lucilia cuprina TaxID=7375 RepID=A0A0L0CFB7_LUCCU|nr:hypothetical protein FF38_06660 [Lucilia cuprina]